MAVSTNQGATVVIPVSWAVGSTPTDVTNQTIAVSALAGGGNVVGPTSTGISHNTTGQYTFQWAVPTSQAVGDYLASWNATLAGSAASQTVVVTVQNSGFGVPTFLTWCDVTLAENLINGQGNVNAVDPVSWTVNVTGQSATLQQVNMAQQVLNQFSNYTPESSGFNMQPNDLHLLRYAVAYQAVWQKNQPGLLMQSNIKQLSQDGLSSTLNTDEGTDRALMLAPLATRCLKQLSWQKSRSLRVRTPFIDDQTPISSDPDAEANDLYERWVDMYNFGYRGSSVP